MNKTQENNLFTIYSYLSRNLFDEDFNSFLVNQNKEIDLNDIILFQQYLLKKYPNQSDLIHDLSVLWNPKKINAIKSNFKPLLKGFLFVIYQCPGILYNQETLFKDRFYKEVKNYEKMPMQKHM